MLWLSAGVTVASGLTYARVRPLGGQVEKPIQILIHLQGPIFCLINQLRNIKKRLELDCQIGKCELEHESGSRIIQQHASKEALTCPLASTV